MKNHQLAELVFGRDGNAQPYLVYGWSTPEDGFTWTDGPEAAVYIPVPCDTPHGIAVELTGVPHQPADGPPLTVTVGVNGRHAAPTRFVRDTYAWTLGLTQPHQALLVTLALPRASRPSEWGHDDERRLGIAVRRVRVFALDERPDAAIRPRTGPVPDAPELAVEFVSLGDDCECGLVQRALGAEPLSLLRFSTAFLPHVLRGIDTNWHALGDGIHVAVESNEWMTRDRGYDLRWHTFLRPEAIAAEALIAKERAKTALLRRKMIEDVSAGDRIFVVKSRQSVQYEQVLALHLALNRVAANWLLWVATGEHAGGALEVLAPRLMRGHVSRFTREGYDSDYVLPEWRAVLANAWSVAKGDGTGVAGGTGRMTESDG
jgi:hypothetical protein